MASRRRLLQLWPDCAFVFEFKFLQCVEGGDLALRFAEAQQPAAREGAHAQPAVGERALAAPLAQGGALLGREERRQEGGVVQADAEPRGAVSMRHVRQM